MTLTEAVITLQHVAEDLAVKQDYVALQKVTFAIKQIKDEESKPKRKFKKKF